MMQVIIDKSFDWTITYQFVQFCCEQLNVYPSKIEIASTEFDDRSACCIDIEEDEFLILVDLRRKNLTQLYASIAHELVHVEQFMRKSLGNLLDHSTNTKYEERWWEHEASEKSVDLVQKFVDIYLKMN